MTGTFEWNAGKYEASPEIIAAWERVRAAGAPDQGAPELHCLSACGTARSRRPVRPSSLSGRVGS